MKGRKPYDAFRILIFNLLPAAVGIMVLVLVFESCWRKCPPDKLTIVSGAGKMRSVSGKGTFVIRSSSASTPSRWVPYRCS
ncbi:hypothetical protein [Collinsella stercoris]|uniref:hypothetical protein n=1 Tax=Collinsella stercoris TaxID=147206 RepID=UPI0039937CE8